MLSNVNVTAFAVDIDVTVLRNPLIIRIRAARRKPENGHKLSKKRTLTAVCDRKKHRLQGSTLDT
jgi:hypothetical protein